MPVRSRMTLKNTTDLSTARLEALILPYDRIWACGKLTVLVRYSRGADFSGTCLYVKRRIHVNLGRHVVYPYRMSTYVARARSNRRRWWKEDYTIELADACQLVLFVFLHELYHWLVRKARRNTRQKESMCDRFAARALATEFRCAIRDSRGRLVPRQVWDFQDVDGFVAAARRKPALTTPPLPVRAARHVIADPGQFSLFADA
jgi:hypothetical protein